MRDQQTHGMLQLAVPQLDSMTSIVHFLSGHKMSYLALTECALMGIKTVSPKSSMISDFRQ